MRRFLMFVVAAFAATFLTMGIVGTAVSHPRANNAESTTVLRFDELPFQPVDGLTFKGVTFRFTIQDVHSEDANYNASNGGIEKYVQDPALEGNSLGILTLTFREPTHIVQFGVARSSFVTTGCVVKLYSATGGLIGSFAVNAQVYVIFPEGLFQYSGTVPAKKAVISFPDAGDRFAIDNLTYRR